MNKRLLEEFALRGALFMLFLFPWMIVSEKVSWAVVLFAPLYVQGVLRSERRLLLQMGFAEEAIGCTTAVFTILLMPLFAWLVTLLNLLIKHQSDFASWAVDAGERALLFPALGALGFALFLKPGLRSPWMKAFTFGLFIVVVIALTRFEYEPNQLTALFVIAAGATAALFSWLSPSSVADTMLRMDWTPWYVKERGLGWLSSDGPQFLLALRNSMSIILVVVLLDEFAFEDLGGALWIVIFVVLGIEQDQQKNLLQRLRTLRTVPQSPADILWKTVQQSFYWALGITLPVVVVLPFAVEEFNALAAPLLLMGLITGSISVLALRLTGLPSYVATVIACTAMVMFVAGAADESPLWLIPLALLGVVMSGLLYRGIAVSSRCYRLPNPSALNTAEER